MDSFIKKVLLDLKNQNFDFSQSIFILPNKKKQKALKQFITDLKKGDKVVTTGGLHGKIVELKELTAIIDAGNNIKLKINRAAISMEASMLLSNDVSED